jgi:hypothetical protein
VKAQQTGESPISSTSDRKMVPSPFLKYLVMPVCIENLIHVDKLEESPKLAE